MWIKLGKFLQIKLGKPELSKREEKYFAVLYIIGIIAIITCMIMNYRGI